MQCWSTAAPQLLTLHLLVLATSGQRSMTAISSLVCSKLASATGRVCWRPSTRAGINSHGQRSSIFAGTCTHMHTLLRALLLSVVATRSSVAIAAGLRSPRQPPSACPKGSRMDLQRRSRRSTSLARWSQRSARCGSAVFAFVLAYAAKTVYPI